MAKQDIITALTAAPINTVSPVTVTTANGSGQVGLKAKRGERVTFTLNSGQQAAPVEYVDTDDGNAIAIGTFSGIESDSSDGFIAVNRFAPDGGYTGSPIPPPTFQFGTGSSTPPPPPPPVDPPPVTDDAILRAAIQRIVREELRQLLTRGLNGL